VLHGFVHDLKPFWINSLAFLCPISDGGGTKLKILEAMAMQAPIIANPIACEGIELEDRESVMHASDPTAYINCIAAISSDRSLRVRLAQNARKILEKKYSTKAVGAQLRAYYDSIHQGLL
jgi:glycosyltransferase involved in cell wall biosynthesis